MASKKKKDAPKVQVASFLKDAVTARLDDPEGLASFPTLMEALLPVYDGSTLIRQGGRLTIKPEGAHWLLTLDMPTEVLSARFCTDSLVRGLEAVEEALRSGKVVFSPGYQKNKKKLPTIDELIQ